jgi:hypothetical protein
VSTATVRAYLSTWLVEGTPTVDGVTVVRHGHTYDIIVRSWQRPTYVNAAPAPRQPAGIGPAFQPDGSVDGVPTWRIAVTIDTGNASADWYLGYIVGGVLHLVRVEVG